MNPQEYESPLELLQIEFSTLDSSLVAAILNDTDDLEAARETLRILYLETIVDDIEPDYGNNSYPEWGDSFSEETDPTTLSLSSWRISEDDEDEESGVLDKLGHLARMFPKQTQFTLKNTLDKCQGDVDKAVDELLNRVFLSEGPEEAHNIKGIDAFDADVSLGGGKKKRRNRKKGRGNENNPPAYHRSVPLPTSDKHNTNHWESMSTEIKHLASSLNLSEKAVSSAYHRCGRAIAPTIISLLDSNFSTTTSLEPSHLDQLSELSREFGSEVKLNHLETLLKLCQENKVAVFEFAEILQKHHIKPTIEINSTSLGSASLPPPLSSTRTNHPGSHDGWTIVGPSYSSSATLPSPPTSPRFSYRPFNPQSASHLLTAHTTARNEAFTSAAMAYRKSKSEPLMGGAASYYANLGHQHNSQVKSIRNNVAEKMVEANSKPNVLDLHGVTVQQAVKFARERTTDWWVRQGREQELAGGAAGTGWGRRAVDPFHIITGLGRHSKGGVPQLMPAVSKMLIRENWKIQVEQGHIIVYGVTKK